MAVTGVNNYSNIYTNAYTGNIQKNNAKETTEKQVVEQTEDVKTGTTRKTAHLFFSCYQFLLCTHLLSLNHLPFLLKTEEKSLHSW